MNLNLFTWIREGVKQAVVLGVADAVDNIGMPADGNDLRQRLVDAVRRSEISTAGATATLEHDGPSNPAKRRRLGRTLDQISSAADES